MQGKIQNSKRFGMPSQHCGGKKTQLEKVFNPPHNTVEERIEQGMNLIPS